MDTRTDDEVRAMAASTPSDQEIARGDRVRDAVPVRRSLTLERVGRIGAGLVVTVAVLLLCWSRLANLGTPFWNDEAYTALNYADAGPRTIFHGSLYIPNNHVLFSLAAWATTRVFGRFEAAYRIWSVLPALAAVLLVAWWVRRIFDAASAVVVIVLATVSEVHLVLSPQARGYGLAMLAGAGMLIGAVRADQQRRRDGIAIFAISGLIGICTLPVFVVAFLLQAVVLFARRDLRRATITACALVGLASAVFYAPLLSGILEHSPQRVGDQLSWNGLLAGPYRHLGKPTLAAFLPQRWRPASAADGAVLVVTCVLAAFGIARLLRRQFPLLLHLVVPVVGTYLILTLTRFYVEDRFTSFLLFHVIVLLAVGATAIWDFASRWRVLQAAAVAVALAAFLVGGLNVVKETRLQAQQPWENFKAVGEIVKSTRIRRVYSNDDPAYSLRYYVGNNRVSALGLGSLRWKLYCALPGPFILVAHHTARQFEPDVACLQQRGGIDMRIAQQEQSPIGSRGAIDVWVIAS